MNPFQVVIFMLFVLPAFMFKEGYKMFSRAMGENDRWSKFLYALLVLLLLIVAILYFKGYR
jgi:membrane-bound metal-dependent hydrolase YbcI (DUF457 family)